MKTTTQKWVLKVILFASLSILYIAYLSRSNMNMTISLIALGCLGICLSVICYIYKHDSRCENCKSWSIHREFTENNAGNIIETTCIEKCTQCEQTIITKTIIKSKKQIILGTQKVSLRWLFSFIMKRFLILYFLVL